MSDPTPEEIADVLDQAADVLLRDGWCQKSYFDEGGRACMREAIGRAALELGADMPRSSVVVPGELTETRHLGSAAYKAATEVARALPDDAFPIFMAPQPGLVSEWQDEDTTTEDDVHDLLRSTAKGLRERAGQPQ